MSCTFRTGKYGKIMWVVSEVVVGIGLKVTVQEQQRRVHHQKEEGEMERYDTFATNTFLTRLEPCVHVHTHEGV